MNVGAKIKLLRKEKKVTQEELAEYLHISSQAISKWETGASSPEIDLLPKLAVFFGVSIDDLLDFDRSMVDAAVEALVKECGEYSRGDAEKAEEFLRRALEKYPNNALLLTCLLEFLQQQNADGSRSAEIIETGERVLACTQDDELKLDVLRIIAETYHHMGEQAMAEYYLERIPKLNFLYYEIAAAIKSGGARIAEIEAAEEICVEKLISVLWMRRLEADAAEREAIDLRAGELLALFKKHDAYRETAEIMERAWNEGSIMNAY